jgi:hypothetical protein
MFVALVFAWSDGEVLLNGPGIAIVLNDQCPPIPFASVKIMQAASAQARTCQ